MHLHFQDFGLLFNDFYTSLLWWMSCGSEHQANSWVLCKADEKFLAFAKLLHQIKIFETSPEFL